MGNRLSSKPRIYKALRTSWDFLRFEIGGGGGCLRHFLLSICLQMIFFIKKGFESKFCYNICYKKQIQCG
jgi:hypothetical protein